MISSAARVTVLEGTETILGEDEQRVRTFASMILRRH
jgi:hypothetical protein